MANTKVSIKHNEKINNFLPNYLTNCLFFRKSELTPLPKDFLHFLRLCLYRLVGNRQIPKSMVSNAFFNKMRRKFTNANAVRNKVRLSSEYFSNNYCVLHVQILFFCQSLTQQVMVEKSPPPPIVFRPEVSAKKMSAKRTTKKKVCQNTTTESPTNTTNPKSPTRESQSDTPTQVSPNTKRFLPPMTPPPLKKKKMDVASPPRDRTWISQSQTLPPSTPPSTGRIHRQSSLSQIFDTIPPPTPPLSTQKKGKNILLLL